MDKAPNKTYDNKWIWITFLEGKQHQAMRDYQKWTVQHFI